MLVAEIGSFQQYVDSPIPQEAVYLGGCFAEGTFLSLLCGGGSFAPGGFRLAGHRNNVTQVQPGGGDTPVYLKIFGVLIEEGNEVSNGPFHEDLTASRMRF